MTFLRNVKHATVDVIVRCVNEQFVWNTLQDSVLPVLEKLKFSWTKTDPAQTFSLRRVKPSNSKPTLHRKANLYLLTKDKWRIYHIFGIEINSRISWKYISRWLLNFHLDTYAISSLCSDHQFVSDHHNSIHNIVSLKLLPK